MGMLAFMIVICFRISMTVHQMETSGTACCQILQVTLLPLKDDRMGKPTQPVIDFLTKAFGSTKRSFHASWYIYPWIEYSQ